MHGLHGKLLEVDLTSGRVGDLAIDGDRVARYLLGSGLAAEMLYRELDPAIGPLDPASPLLFLCGLFTGSPLPAASKMSVCGRSPLTGIWNEATVGGHFPTELRRTGYDGVLVRGQAERPVYLHLSPERAELRDAGALWGLDTYALEQRLRPELGRKAKIAAIGPAGERGVGFAAVVCDAPVSRLAGRGGMGAVMGSKRLKAIVADGDPKLRPSVADPDRFKRLLKPDSEAVRGGTAGLRAFGTSGGVRTVEMNGELPIKNWQLGSWRDQAIALTGQTIQPRFLDRHYACFSCPIRCAKIYRHEPRELHGHGPEFETLGMLGANCLNDDPEAVVEANEWCNRYGLDSISTGSAIGFAMEAFERGAIGLADTDGVPLAWGGETVVRLVHAIGRGEGLGVLLGRGVRAAAAEMGGVAAEYAIHTKGMEYPAHDPRGHVSMALGYATAVRGACHLETLSFFLDRGVALPDLGFVEPPDPHTSADKPPIVVDMQNYMSVFNPLGLCKFLFLGGVGPSKLAEWVDAYAGLDLGMAGVLEIGERLFNLKRLYDCRLGISRKDDVLPPRLFAHARPDGVSRGVLADLGNMLDHYYRLRGWTPEGIPGADKLLALGLGAEASVAAQDVWGQGLGVTP